MSIKWIYLASCILLFTLCGCTAMEERLDRSISPFSTELGAAYKAQREAQKVDPTPADTTPVTGLDAVSTTRALKKYRAPEAEDKGPTFAEIIRQVIDADK